jgi:transposase
MTEKAYMVKTIRLVLKPLNYQKRFLLSKARAIPAELCPKYEKGTYPEGSARIVNNAIQKMWHTMRSTKQIPIDKQISLVVRRNGILFLRFQKELLPIRLRQVPKIDELLLNDYQAGVIWLKGDRWVADLLVKFPSHYDERKPEAVIGIDLGKWHNVYSVWVDGIELYRAFDKFGDTHDALEKVSIAIAELQSTFKGTRRQLAEALKPLYEKKKAVLRQYYGTLRNKILGHVPEGHNTVFVLEDLDDLPRSELNRTQRKWACQELANRLFREGIEWNGYKVVLVDPRGTTHTCSRCGTTWRGNPKDRKMHCQACGLTLDRDLNGARNIAKRYMLFGSGEHTCTPETDFPIKAICEEGIIEKQIGD